MEGTHTVLVTAYDAAGNSAVDESASYTATNAFPTMIEAEVYLSPDTLNLKSGGKWVTAYIELPEGYDVSRIDISSVFLNGAVSAVTNPKYDFVTDRSEYLTDFDFDGISERMVKFDRGEVESILEAGDKVRITFTGSVKYSNGVSSGMVDFEGSTVIKVIEPDKKDKTKK